MLSEDLKKAKKSVSAQLVILCTSYTKHISYTKHKINTHSIFCFDSFLVIDLISCKSHIYFKICTLNSTTKFNHVGRTQLTFIQSERVKSEQTELYIQNIL